MFDIRACEQWQIHGAWFSAKERTVTKGLRERYLYASTIPKTTYESQMESRREFTQQLRDLLNENHLLVLPTMPCVAPLVDSSHDEVVAFIKESMKLLSFSSLSGFPQITLPLGEVHESPYGISLLGLPYSDEKLIEIGKFVLENVKIVK